MDRENFRQFIFAREYRGLTQTQLAKMIPGLSQSNLSKFEQGLDVLSDQVKNELIAYLDFPRKFFTQKIENTLENAHYRKRATVTKTSVLNFETICKTVGFIVDKMSQIIEWPENKIYPMNIDDGHSPEYIARFTRKKLGLSSYEPILNIFSILESIGIIIYELNFDEKFDGISFTSDLGYPIIILNKNFSNDRKRRTLVHEFGHLIMHNENNFPIPDLSRDQKIKEIEVEKFTSEFLTPEDEITRSLSNLRLNDLASLKSYWLVSMSSIIRRAKDLGKINNERYRYLQIELSRNGWIKNEPVNVPIDEPKTFKKAYHIMKNDLNYDENDFVEALYLPKNVLDQLLFIDRFKLHKI